MVKITKFPKKCPICFVVQRKLARKVTQLISLFRLAIETLKVKLQKTWSILDVSDMDEVQSCVWLRNWGIWFIQKVNDWRILRRVVLRNLWQDRVRDYQGPHFFFAQLCPNIRHVRTKSAHDCSVAFSFFLFISFLFFWTNDGAVAGWNIRE